MTHFSMFSQTKQDDMNLLYEIGEMIVTLTKFMQYEMVEDMIIGFNQSYEQLKTKIETHDYTPDDIIENRINSYLKW